MINKGVQTHREALSRTRKVCKIIDAIFKVILIALAFWGVASFSVHVISLFSPSFQSDTGATVLSLLVFTLSWAILLTFIATLSRTFSDDAKGISPFSIKQVRRFRILTLLSALYFFLEIIASFFSVQLQLLNIETGFFTTQTNSISYMTINFVPLLVAGVFLALSYVLKYGILLQESHDGTV